VNPAELRARCEARLAGLHIPDPFDLTAFCAHLADRRGRPIVLHPMELAAASPSGLWIRGEHRDYIVYEIATTPLHQTHIALHEIGHLLCGHESVENLDRLFPTLDPRLVRRALGRAGYSSTEEFEAELLASLILRRASSAAPAPPVASSTDQVLRRLESSL
jgi:hypothetical protein